METQASTCIAIIQRLQYSQRQQIGDQSNKLKKSQDNVTSTSHSSWSHAMPLGAKEIY